MSVTDNPEIIADVLYHWVRLKHSPFKVAREVGIDARSVLTIINEHGHKVSEQVERHEGLGRPELRKFMVAKKHASELWDNEDYDVAKARADYEAGLVDLATGRDGRWLILYAFPRKRIQPRPNYFKPEPSL